MCRLLAYLGPDTSLHELVIKPEHSLEKQAWQPKQLREAKLNADGFGFGWYHNTQVMRYRQPIPIWNDPNLVDLSKTIQTTLWFAMVRSATPGLGTHYYNTQPFQYQQWLFMHNGYILDFADTARSQLRHILDDEFEANIEGSTDSEYIFALILHFMKQSSALEAIETAFQTLSDILGDGRALLNIMLTDGEQILATRYAVNGLCPTLYYAKGLNDFSKDSQILASEAFDENESWQAVADNQLIVLSRQNPVIKHSL